MKVNSEEELSFEEAVSRLEQIVSVMETGNLSLNESLARFEQAVALSRLCSEQLAVAEERVQVLTVEHGLQPVEGPSWMIDSG